MKIKAEQLGNTEAGQGEEKRPAINWKSRSLGPEVEFCIKQNCRSSSTAVKMSDFPCCQEVGEAGLQAPDNWCSSITKDVLFSFCPCECHSVKWLEKPWGVWAAKASAEVSSHTLLDTGVTGTLIHKLGEELLCCEVFALWGAGGCVTQQQPCMEVSLQGDTPQHQFWVLSEAKVPAHCSDHW